MTDSTETTPNLTTYTEAVEAYLAASPWITAAEGPLVHHARAIARQLDAAGDDAVAATMSAYLQAIERLNKRRPTTSVPAIPQLPGQTSILDFAFDD